MATQVEDIKWFPSNTDRRFMVDGFNFKTPACQTYFLTHFHSDHTCGLTKRFELGYVYTSEITARLLVHDMGLPERCVRVLPLYSPVTMHGCRITLLDANHCPGAVMLLIEVLQDKRGVPVAKPEIILHMGDCRWEDRLADQIPRGLRVDTVFMDTTYAAPKYTFPAQEIVLDALAEEIRTLLAAEPRTLLVVASYHIGKEKVYLGLARRLGIKVWCSEAKRRVLTFLDLPQSDLAQLTHDPSEAGLHVTGWGMRPDQLQQRFLKAAQAAGVQVSEVKDESQDPALPGADVPTAVADGTLGTTSVRVKVESTEASSTGLGPDEDMLAYGEGELPPPPGYVYEGAEEEAGAAAAVADKWQRVIGIKATGWSFRKKGKLVSHWKAGLVTILGAPYSEHSSYNELCSCVRLLRPSRIVPTVNAATPAASKALVERFVHLMDLSKQKGRLDMYLKRTPSISNSEQTNTSTHNTSAPPPTTRSDLTPATITIDLTDDTPCVGDTAQVCGSHPAQPSMINTAQPSVADGAAQPTGEEDEDTWVRDRVLGSAGQGCGCFAKPQFADDGLPPAAGHSPTQHEATKASTHTDTSAPQELMHAGPQHPTANVGLQGDVGGAGSADASMGQAHEAVGLVGTSAAGAAAQGSAAAAAGAEGSDTCAVGDVDVREQQRIWDLIQRDRQRQEHAATDGGTSAGAKSAGRGGKGGRGGKRSAKQRGDSDNGAGATPSATAGSGKGDTGASNGGTSGVTAGGSGKGKRRKTSPSGLSSPETIVLDASPGDMPSGAGKACGATQPGASAPHQASIRSFFVPARAAPK